MTFVKPWTKYNLLANISNFFIQQSRIQLESIPLGYFSHICIVDNEKVGEGSVLRLQF